jgi:hypothetical protein
MTGAAAGAAVLAAAAGLVDLLVDVVFFAWVERLDRDFTGALRVALVFFATGLR